MPYTISAEESRRFNVSRALEILPDAPDAEKVWGVRTLAGQARMTLPAEFTSNPSDALSRLQEAYRTNSIEPLQTDDFKETEKLLREGNWDELAKRGKASDTYSVKAGDALGADNDTDIDLLDEADRDTAKMLKARLRDIDTESRIADMSGRGVNSANGTDQKAAIDLYNKQVKERNEIGRKLQPLVDEARKRAAAMRHVQRVRQKNAFTLLNSISADLDDRTREIVDRAVANGYRLADGDEDAFALPEERGGLPESQKELAASFLLYCKPVEGKGAWDAFLKRMGDNAAQVVGNTASGVGDLFSGVFHGFDKDSYRDRVNRRAWVNRINARNFADLGTLGNSFAEAGGIIGYWAPQMIGGAVGRGTRLATRLPGAAGRIAARGVGMAGLVNRWGPEAMYFADYRQQFLERVALDGGDVTNPAFQVAATVGAAASAYVEHIQWGRAMGKVGLEEVQAQAYAKLSHRILAKLGIKVGTEFGSMTAGRAARLVLMERGLSAVTEGFEEAIQQAIEETVVQFGDGQGICLADIADQSGEAFVSTLGPMMWTMMFGLPFRAKSAATMHNLDGDAIDRLMSAGSRLKRLAAAGKLDQGGDDLASLNELLFVTSRAPNADAGVRSLRERGFSQAQATDIWNTFETIRRESIQHGQMDALGSNVLPTGEELRRTGWEVTDNPDGTTTASRIVETADGRKRRQTINVRSEASQSVDIGDDSQAVSTLNTIRQEVAGRTAPSVSEDGTPGVIPLADKIAATYGFDLSLDNDAILANPAMREGLARYAVDQDLRVSGNTRLAETRKAKDADGNEIDEDVFDVPLTERATRRTIFHEVAHAVAATLRNMGLSEKEIDAIQNWRSGLDGNAPSEADLALPQVEGEAWDEERVGDELGDKLTEPDERGRVARAMNYIGDMTRRILGIRKEQQNLRDAVSVLEETVRRGYFGNIDDLNDAQRRVLLAARQKRAEDRARREAEPPAPAPAEAAVIAPAPPEETNPSEIPTGSENPNDSESETPPDEEPKSVLDRAIDAFCTNRPLQSDEMAALAASGEVTQDEIYETGYRWHFAANAWAISPEAVGRKFVPSRRYRGLDGKWHDTRRDGEQRYAVASRVTPAEDAAYLDAVSRGDMETAQRMVREAAARVGYVIEAWHGTKGEVSLERLPARVLTETERRQYENERKAVEGAALEWRQKRNVRSYCEYKGIDFDSLSDEEINAMHDEAFEFLKNVSSLSYEERQKYYAADDRAYKKHIEEFGREPSPFDVDRKWGQWPEDKWTVTKPSTFTVFDADKSRDVGFHFSDEPTTAEEFAFKDQVANEGRLIHAFLKGEIIDFRDVFSRYLGLEDAMREFYRVGLLTRGSWNKLIDRAKRYDAETEIEERDWGDRPKVINWWRHLREAVEKTARKKNDIVLKYDNEVEGGGAFAVLKPSQIKSADPVTYDDAGNVIPLSQRFNPEREDIRYQISGLYTGSAADYAERDENGNVVNGPSLVHVGSGEGSQVYGWGLYASNVRGVAEGYAAKMVQSKRNRPSVKINGKEYVQGRYDGTIEPWMQVFLNHAFSATAWMRGKDFRKKLLASARQSLKLAEKGAKSDPETFGEMVEANRKVIDFLSDPKNKIEFHDNAHIYEQTFFTDRADGEETERHLLKWFEPVSKEHMRWVVDEARAEGVYDRLAYVFNLKKQWGGDLYENIAKHLGPRGTSEFLARAGIDGVKYPVDSYGGKGVKNGDEAGWNYVSFRDDNIRVDHKWVDGVQRYQISGSVGAEALGIRNLADAEAMERSGASRLDIWRETGWQRGTDGEWRRSDDPPTPQKRFTVAPHGVQKQAGVEYPDAGAEIARFAVGAKRRAAYADVLARKRPDLDAEKVLAELDKLGDPKKEKVALHWVVRGSLLLPQDAYKIDDALDVAAKAKVDPFAYKSPDELLLANKQFKPSARPIDPATVPELSDARDEGDGIVSYEVQDDQQGQAAMRRIIDTHWGDDANPWCLLARDKNTEDWTNLYRSWFGMAYPNELQTADNFKKFADEFERRTGSRARAILSDEERMRDAWYYWNHYDALPKRVAFKDGKLLAFMATDVLDNERAQDEAAYFDGGRLAELYPKEYEEYINALENDEETRENQPNFYEWLNHSEEYWDLVTDLELRNHASEQWWDRKDESHPDLDWARPRPADSIGPEEGERDGRAAVAGRVRAFDDEPHYSPRASLAAVATMELLAGREPDRDALEQMRTRLGLESDVDEVVEEAKTMLDSEVGKIARRGAGRNPGAVAVAIAESVQGNHPEDLVREAFMAGANAQKWAQGTRGAALNALVRNARGDNYADLVLETGVDATGVLQSFPDMVRRRRAERQEPAPAPAGERPDEATEAKPAPAGEAPSLADIGPIDPNSPEGRRIAEIQEQQEANIEKAIRETEKEMEQRRLDAWLENADKRDEEAAKSAKDDVNEDGDGGDGDLDESDESGVSRTIRIPVEVLERNLVDVSDPETFTLWLRKVVRNRILKANGLSTDFPDLAAAQAAERDLWANPTNVAAFAKSMSAILRDMARRMLERGSGAYTEVLRKAATLPHYDDVDAIEDEVAFEVRVMSAASISQTSARLVNETRRKLKRDFIGATQPNEHPELQDDLVRKITGRVREMAKWYRNVLALTEGGVEKMRDTLEARLEERGRNLDEAGMTSATDRENDAVWDWTNWKLKVLDRFGGTRYLLPAEARERLAEIETWMAKEGMARAQKMETMTAQYEADRKTIIEGCRIVDREGRTVKHEKDTRFEGFWRYTVNTIDQRLRLLFARARGDAGRAAKALRDRTSLRLAQGTTRDEREKQEMHRALVQTVRNVVGPRGVRAWIERMTQEIPEEQAVALSKQNNRHLTYGQVMHLYGYLRQTATYGENIAKFGREGQRDYIERNVLTAEDIKILDGMMQIYADNRPELDEASRDLTGFPMKNPDPFYLPVKIKQKARSGLETTVSTVQAMPEVFSERRRHGLDVDEKADIMVMFYDRMEQTARVLGFGRTGLDIIHTFGSAEVKEAITEARGAKFTTALIAHFTDWMNGGRPRLVTKEGEDAAVLNSLRTAFVYTALWGNTLSAFKQTLSEPVFSLAREAGERGIFRDMMGVFSDGWKQAKAELTQSDPWKVRYGDVGVMQETKEAVLGAGDGTLWQAILRAGMQPLQWGDATPGILCQVTAYMVERDRLIEDGMEPEEAKRIAADKAMQQVEWTQQSSRAENLPEYARRGSSAMRMMMMFASSPMLQAGWEVQRFAEWREKREAFGPDAKETKDAAAALWNAVVVNHVVMPVLFQTATAIFNLALGKEPPDEKDAIELAFNMLIGPFARLVFFGGMAKGVWNAAWSQGLYGRSDVVPSLLTNSEQNVKDVIVNIPVDLFRGDMDEALADIDKFLKRNVAPYRHVRQAVENWGGED